MSNYPRKCPRCKQGKELHKVFQNQLRQILYICSECDATWEREEDILGGMYFDRGNYYAERGIDSTQDDEILDNQDPNNGHPLGSG